MTVKAKTCQGSFSSYSPRLPVDYSWAVAVEKAVRHEQGAGGDGASQAGSIRPFEPKASKFVFSISTLKLSGLLRYGHVKFDMLIPSSCRHLASVWTVNDASGWVEECTSGISKGRNKVK